MRSRTIGGLKVSVVGLGCNNFGRSADRARTAAVVSAALDAGVTLFDTADAYGGGGDSERFLGAALGRRRDEAVVATKFGMAWPDDPGHGGGAHPDYVRRSCEESLRRLGTDRIDLYQLHTPDSGVPIADTLEALTDLRDAGKIVEIGCSNFSAAQIDGAQAASAEHDLAAFASVQNEYSLLHRVPETDGVLDACGRHGLAFLPYFPLAKGMLTGKYRRGAPLPEGTRLATQSPERTAGTLTGANFDRVEALEAFCAERGHSLLDLAVSWLASQPAVASVIAGATRPEQIRANAAAAAWQLDTDELAEIDRLAPPAP